MKTKTKRKSALRWLLPLMGALALCGLLFTLGYHSGARSASLLSGGARNCTIRYMIDGEVYEKETVSPGAVLAGVGYPAVDGRVVTAWLDGNGRECAPDTLRAYTDMTFTAALGWELSAAPGYFPCAGGLFRPESPLTRREAAELLYSLMAATPAETAPLSDMDSDSEGYKEAAALVGAGILAAPNGFFSPDAAFTEDDFAALLQKFFRTAAVEQAVGAIRGVGGSEVTRAEAAVALNALLGVAGETDTAVYFPDVQPGYWAETAIKLAGAPAFTAPLAEGFTNINGFLYHVESDGYFLKNACAGSLFFDADGRFASGNGELDAYVAAAIRENTTPDMDREEMLRAMYLFVRDGFEYLRRNYYETGARNWALQEALTMYSTGRGNCYCYASAFWAAARGLGYDAMVVSGTIGSDLSPHGWVEIPQDGKRYVYDVEIEMAYHKEGKTGTDMYKLEQVSARYSWLYVEYVAANKVVAQEDPAAYVLR